MDDFLYVVTCDTPSHLLSKSAAQTRARAKLLIDETPNKHHRNARLKNLFFEFANTDVAATPRSFPLNLTHPAQLYPEARAIQRQIHVHVGPTNSGKTYHALQKLQQAESGVYAGPLRLLALEVYERMLAKGKTCGLLTGDDRRVPEEDDTPALVSCTVEMVPLGKRFDVAVIDEIQLLGDDERGSGWTKALLGLCAREIHVCGEARTVPILETLAAACGDTLHIHHYERLSPLQMMKKPIKATAGDLRKGDAIVGFSTANLFDLRRTIERSTRRKCAIIYGALPPEIRAKQAELFNDPNNDYDFLVATSAIGMGLNLSIKRLIFESRGHTADGVFQPRSNADIKQIAGRAGRFRSAAQDNNPGVGMPPSENKGGLVTVLSSRDYAPVRQAMYSEPPPIQHAYFFADDDTIEKFSNSMPPGTPFAVVLGRIFELAKVDKTFRMSFNKDQLAVAELIDDIPNLTIAERLALTLCPTNADSDFERPAFRAFAAMVAEGRAASIDAIPEVKLELLQNKTTPDRQSLLRLQDLYKVLVSYLWLSYKFSGIFLDQESAFYAKSLVERKLQDTLTAISDVASQSVQAKEKAAFEELMDALGQPEDMAPAMEGLSVKGRARRKFLG